MSKTASFARHQAVGAYRRWAPPDFGAPLSPVVEPESVPETELINTSPSVAETQPKTPQVKEKTEAAPPPVPLPTAAEIEQIHEEARRNGFDEGFKEGFDEGLPMGRQKGHVEGRETGFREGREAGFAEGRAAAENEALRLRDLIAQLEQALARLDAEIAEELMSLAIEFARKIIQHTLAVEPEAVVSAIRTVLQTLPQTRAQIHLNPDDIALAQRHLGEVLTQAEHVLVEDETVSPGGCRVETPGAQIDATMETRWRRAIESLGREHTPWTPSSDRRTKTRRASDKPRKKTQEQDASAPTIPDAPSEPS